MPRKTPTEQVQDLFTKASKRQRWLDVEAALATAEAQLGIIPAEAARTIAASARLELLDEAELDAQERVTGHVMVPIIRELSRVTGPEAGGWVHWGATTQNIQQSGDTVGMVQALGIVELQLERVIKALAVLTSEHANTLMAGRTHWQQAVPITFGYKTAAWLDTMLRHRERLGELRPRLAVSMTGGAAGTFATFGEPGPRVQELVAEELGLRPMAIPGRGIADHFAEFATVLALMAASCSQIAGEVSRLMAVEFGELCEEIPDGDVGSSTMPQKRNPKLSAGVVTNAAIVQSAVPMALEAMIQSHEVDGARSALMDHAVMTAAVHGAETLGLLAQLLEGLQVFPERMKANLTLTHGLISAEAVMMSLAGFIGRQEAHDVVHHAATQAAVSGTDFLEVLREEPRIAKVLTEDQLEELLDPARHTGLSEQLAHETVARAEQALAGR
ncbi:class-II fumarase/aspartase family protein [Psychromicrobium xiongbiense]|uniref:class-II fumarase/aspartase family protein n=1 Tax=Psychromicrobium xiongbiense TaxID=3051184 RepID=UPI0025544CA2|nr:adenylosuccinate lyase family protein [Psychromicrobium sp. YIM S02556]